MPCVAPKSCCLSTLMNHPERAEELLLLIIPLHRSALQKTTSVTRLKGAMSREDIVVFRLVLCWSHYLVPLPTVHKILGTLVQFWPPSLCHATSGERIPLSQRCVTERGRDRERERGGGGAELDNGYSCRVMKISNKLHQVHVAISIIIFRWFLQEHYQNYLQMISSVYRLSHDSRLKLFLIVERNVLTVFCWSSSGAVCRLPLL